IAHIDHGKSTLADRILEFVGAIDRRNFHDQLLDDMELERERGITIKASTVRLEYKAKNGTSYALNLIDTPGHVDFTYEVSKALAACEGALLVVDATQGIEAQTVANFNLAKELNLKIIPVINKIDLPSADADRVKLQLVEVFNFEEKDIILASAKEGKGIEDILEQIVATVPVPSGDGTKPLKALIFDSVFDIYRGVIVYLKIIDGTMKSSDTVKMMQASKTYKVEELGVLKDLKMTKVESLSCGEVGYFISNIRSAAEVAIGDTVFNISTPLEEPLPGFRKLKPLVFCGLYPVNAADFDNLRASMEKLRLTDASFVYEPESSVSFGFGFRCGFLGLLHMEIIQERLEREYSLNLILTVPSVVYRIKKKGGEIIDVDNPEKFPGPQDIDEAEEPYVVVTMLIPTDSLDAVHELSRTRRGMYNATEFLGSDRVKLVFDMPLSEILVDFFDKLKSVTRGYGSMDYEFIGYFPTKLVKLDILINGDKCDAFSSILHKEMAYEKGRNLVSRLKDLIPRQLFEVSIQAAVGSQVIASEKVRAAGKNVTAKCYGGDITRKRKLWEKQKKGKARMKQFGKVEIPQEAFLEVLKI
ncbi:MAG TPA: elongation factor 4, partial [Candidatus Omnitrophica bacterium]|nr:elongation factor 4 [Candidatus Omnitrophota bacterium]